jgi:ABC-type branched-subunit amino acid transport system substrate-binding protein
MRASVARYAALAAVVALGMAACSSDDGDGGDGSAATCEPDGVVKIGTVLPQTGNSSFLWPATSAAVTAAVQEINDAGGILGEEVELFEGDSGDTTTTIAVTTADQLLQRGVDAVVGTASSEVTKTIIDKVTGAGVLQISPADTSTELIDWPDRGLYFRTAPADQFQGAILAQVAGTDAIARPAILARQDTYGESLANAFETSFTAAGGTLALPQVLYDPAASSFEAEVSQIKAATPDAIVLIGFRESIKIVQEMIRQGIGPKNVQLYLVDGNLSNALFADAPEGAMEGAKGTLPGAEASGEFRQKLLAVDADITDFSYGAESYDAVNLVALAAAAAGSDCGTDIAAKMQEVSAVGELCTTYAQCSELLAAGTDIDYDGQSGPIEFGDNGDPTVAVMGVYVFGADNKIAPDEFIEGEVPPLPTP